MPDAATTHPQRAPRRLLKRVFLLLALGVATTVIVASALSALASHWTPNRVVARFGVYELNTDGFHAFRTWPQSFPGVDVYSWSPDATITDLGSVQTKALAAERSIDSPATPGWSCIRDENIRREAIVLTTPINLHADWIAGWPLPALRGRMTPASLTDTQRIQLRGGMLRFRGSTARISIGDGLWLTGHLFPLIPMWPGFLINTAVYATAWAALLAAFARIRRSIRTRRGQCPGCAYDLRNSPRDAPCPECGRVR